MTPKEQVLAATQGLPKVTFETGWKSSRIAGRGEWRPKFVMLHHTAGTSSLRALKHTAWPPVPGAHFLIDRDGTIHVISASKTYHAGRGGPRWGVPAGMMNSYAWGIEIEDLGQGQTMTPAQIEATARLAGGLLDAMGKDLDALIQHKQWHPTGKVDTRYATSWWRDRVTEYTAPKTVKEAAVAVDEWPVGRSWMDKTPADKPIMVKGGEFVTVAQVDLPKGRYLCELQVGMPRGVGAGEAHLGRLGWGTASGDKVDETGHNAIAPASDVERWRSPICHQIAGGGTLLFRIWLPAGSTYPVRCVAKALRLS